ncbi:MAG: hypothetical protein DRR16_28380 [Candidatus Parabeggiatoa sp. nov. 3]|nr:MAG: hypothetical protein DRR00_27985 [Gammaproteobacteria bacterium]RKZ57102.1 MAG: hypothetical protein DRQ99_27450 [Gammaproteobacteria bacterium]RKZ78091.1 MAG: hypothetical protein DRR16_28380 [Gammaproteobacteria bacterium]
MVQYLKTINTTFKVENDIKFFSSPTTLVFSKLKSGKIGNPLILKRLICMAYSQRNAAPCTPFTIKLAATPNYSPFEVDVFARKNVNLETT